MTLVKRHGFIVAPKKRARRRRIKKMEWSGGRGHRNCCYRQIPGNSPPIQKKSSGTIQTALNFLLMVVFIACLYHVLHFHCTTWQTRYNQLNYLTKNLEDLVKNLSTIQLNYHDLGTQVSVISKQLPKLEGQIEVLEALAINQNKREPVPTTPVWDPVKNPCGVLPANVDATFISRTCAGDNNFN